MTSFYLNQRLLVHLYYKKSSYLNSIITFVEKTMHFSVKDLKECNNSALFDENIDLYVKYVIFDKIYSIKYFQKWFQ